MISRLAMNDIDALRADGCDVPPREVVRLNALGLAVERSADAAAFAALPRVVFLGQTVFHEPTVADELWYAAAARLFDVSDCETRCLLRAVCLSTRADARPSADDVRGIRKAIKAFTRGPARDFTFCQLLVALLYVIEGGDHASGELPPPKDGETRGGASGDDAVAAGVLLRDGVALQLGSVAELSALTASQLLALIARREDLAAGKDAAKRRHAAALGDYLRALDAVRDAAKGGTENE